MLITGVPSTMLDIDSNEAPCHIEIQFSPSGDHLWVHMNGKTIVRLYGVGEIEITNARIEGQRLNLAWYV
mgnify:CR=1 FL=1